MKNIKSFVFFPFLALFILLGCEKDKGEVMYEGDSLLNFSRSSSQVFILEGSGTFDLTITYGVVKPVSGSHTVSLVPDTETSQAIQGVDYEIINATDELASGESISTFVVRFFESSATLEGKNVTFKVQSSTLPSAIFNNLHTVNTKITCPVEVNKFVGSYLIEELTPYVDGPTLDDGSIVTINLIPGSLSGRTFLTRNYPNYCAPLRAFNFDLICGDVIVRPDQDSTCDCTADGLFFGPADVPSNYDVSDDSVFELTFTNDVTSDCGSPVQTTYRFTKQ